MKFKFKRLKIIEQIIVVIFISVFIPFTVTAFIVNNENQHGIRRELKHTAIMISDIIAQNIKEFLGTDSNALHQTILAIKHIDSDYKINAYLQDLDQYSKDFKDISITYNKPVQNSIYFDKIQKEIVINEKIDKNRYLIAKIDLNKFKQKVFDSVKQDTRQIYILDAYSKELIISHNFSQDEFNIALKTLPKNLIQGKSEIYGKIKNEPLAYFLLDDFLIITNTTSTLAGETIYTAQFNIILSFIIAGLIVIFIIGLYTYYLYINLRQLFKGIVAISKGNYKRKIRFLTNIFTPFEITFLALEFNKMVYKINVSYRKLKEYNQELKLVNDFRSNLVDTVSHELRTPLTSIMGYTSRLLRQDIEIDEDVKIKSLKIIKRQSERLSRMVEDLLVIPDIENSNLKIEVEKTNLNELINDSLTLIKDFKNHNFIIKNKHNFFISSNKDRLEQVLINLIENASKYSDEDSDIIISTYEDNLNNNFAIIKIENKADYIPEDKLNKLFEKFTRIDDKTTRTTRGTGLGLFIVKGLIQAMDGEINIHSSKNNLFTVILKLKKWNDE